MGSGGFSCGDRISPDYPYQQRLWEHRMMCSMSRRGDCYDNAVIESFFHTLKVERVHWQDYESKQEAIEDVNS